MLVTDLVSAVARNLTPCANEPASLTEIASKQFEHYARYGVTYYQIH
jgi:hypothetical protein